MGYLMWRVGGWCRQGPDQGVQLRPTARLDLTGGGSQAGEDFSHLLLDWALVPKQVSAVTSFRAHVQIVSSALKSGL